MHPSGSVTVEQAGKAVAFFGAGLVFVGGVMWCLGRFAPGFRLGRLPGDIAIEKPGFSIYFPITTMILVSLVASMILWIVSALRK